MSFALGLGFLGVIGSLSSAATALREVGTRTALGAVVSANTLPYNSWNVEHARSPIAAIRVAWANWGVVGGVETVTGGVMTVTAAVEFPMGGTITQLTFSSGATSIAIANGLEGVSDMVALPRTIPAMLGAPALTFAAAGNTITRATGSWVAEGYQVGDTVAIENTASNNVLSVVLTSVSGPTLAVASGVVNEGPTVGGVVSALYRVRFRWVNTVGMAYTNVGPYKSTALGDRTRQDATDFTLSASMTDDGGNNYMWPSRIMAMTTLANDTCLIEDSRGVGFGESTATQDTGHCGQTARSLGPKHALFRLQQGGGTANGFAGGHVRQSRLAALAPPSSVVIVLGINDIHVGRTAAQIKADIVTAANSFPSTTKVYVGTVYPRTTSTDSWATTVNQTVDSGEAQRLALNALIRTLSTSDFVNFAGFLELSTPLETALNSGIFKATGGTGQAANTIDGLHASALGDKLELVSIP